MPKLREIFDLPEQVHQGDFVLRLTDGLNAPVDTVRNYIATPQLVKCFDQALGVVKSAIDSGISKGAYLHGSFGAGKSHFMAILSLLLRGDPTARGKPELAPVVSKHNAWTQGKKFLVVPYHMINAETLEAALFSGYAELTTELYPNAPNPGFYQSEGILKDAQILRASMGDDAFFHRLNDVAGGTSGGGGWGRIAQAWTAPRFETALQAPPGSQERFQLVGALTRAFFSTISHLSASQRELYTSLDEGLAAMSQHARDLGYDAIILFLDEFILWLASRAADTAWITREGQKVAKLVESGNADRPVPIVSFMARQRDLRELVGEHLPGAEQLSFADTLQWWEARFDKVSLEDRNLPEIAKKRLLRTRGPSQEAQLKHAIDKLLSSQPEILQTLLTREGDQQMLRDLYPFTPALVQTLIAVSSMLQRERTALKLMQQMLVDKADRLELGDIIPVGDLFDVIAQGDEPFTHGIKLFFEQTKQLWRRRLLPILELQHGVAWEEIEAGTADPKKATALRNDARLLKTLVLAALVPEVEALKALTPSRLAALNHGTIRTPVPGSEGSAVLIRLKRWAGQAGEIKIADDAPNPVVTLEIARVDTDAILANAMNFDTQGNRQAEVRQLITDGLGLADTASSLLPPELEITWRGSRRRAEILFGNIREQSDDTLKGREGIWRILVDFPFDQPPHGPRDDDARINGFLDQGLVGRALAWLPSFLAPATQDQLGRLVVINFVLRGNNLDQYAAHLSQADREQARLLLTNQRDQLRQFMRNCLYTAYGLNTLAQETLDPAQTIKDHFRSLDPSLNLRPPVAAGFKDAFEKLLEQALDYEFPAHPRFETEPRAGAVKRLAGWLTLAARQPARRIELDAAVRDDARRIAPKLELAEVGEVALQLRDDWSQHFARQLAQPAAGREPTVGDLRRWLDLPTPRGLRDDLQDLVILTWLAMTNRSLYRFGQPFQGEVGKLPDECEAREQPLPDADVWERATRLAGDLLDPVSAGLYRSAPGLAEFARVVRKRMTEVIPQLSSYLRNLEQLMKRVLTAETTTTEPPLRRDAARRLRDALVGMESCKADIELANRVATLDLTTEEIAEAKAVLGNVPALARVETEDHLVNSLQTIAGGGADFALQAGLILERLTHAVLRYEYVEALQPAIARFERDTSHLMAEIANRNRPLPKPPEPADKQKPMHRIERARLSKTDALTTLAEVREWLEGLETASVDLQIVIRSPV
ncbi:MAG: hypothetical protein U1F76_06805 [Candidatus Competibacteraceae bacterium]